MASLGIQVLANPPNAIVDMVFVHGLTGGRESTWTEDNSKVFWPKDLLHDEVPNARIMTFGYDADIVNILRPASSNSIRSYGQALLNELALRRKRTKTEKRPLVFIAHSLGGLVCEEALLISRGAGENHLTGVLESTSAIAFMGTPHAGSSIAEWTKIVTNLSRLLKRSNKEIGNVLRPGPEVLADLQHEFQTMLNARQMQSKMRPIKISCLFEELPVDEIGEIVPKHAAILTAYDSGGILANHLDMTKFTGKEDEGFKAVSDQLKMWTSEIEANNIQDRAATTTSKKKKNITEIRAVRLKEFGTMEDASREGLVF